MTDQVTTAPPTPPRRRGRRLMLVTAAVVVVATASVTLVLLLGRSTTSTPPTRSASLSVHPSSDRATRAMQELDAPSLPQPLQGSAMTADHGFLVPGPCADAQARYLAAGAPLPHGATAQVTGPGAIAVDGPWGTSSLIFKDGKSGCYYWVHAKPTVIAVGKGPAPTGDAVAGVGCFLPVDQGGTQTTAPTIGGKPFVISVSPNSGQSSNEKFDPAKGWSVIIFQGTFADLQTDPGGSDSAASLPPAAFGGRGGVYPSAVTTAADGTIIVTVTGGDAKGTVIQLTCTGDVTSLMPAAPTPAPGV